MDEPFLSASFIDVPQQPSTLEVACLTTRGTLSVTPLATRVSILGDTFQFNVGSMISDDDGNPIISWSAIESPHDIVPKPTITTFVSGAFGTTQLNACLLGNGLDNRAMVLGETGSIYVSCHAASPSTSDETILYSVDPGGGVNWTFGVPTHHSLHLMSALSGGGVLIKDTTLGEDDLGIASENAVQIDTAGNSAAAAWSTTAPSDLRYLGDGIFANLGDHSSSPIQMITTNITDASSVWHSTDESDKHHRGESIDFLRDQTCSGFDDTINLTC